MFLRAQHFLSAKCQLTCFDGDGDGSSGDGDGTKNNEPEKKFTQEEVNTFVAEEKRRNVVRQKELVAELNQLRESANISEEEKGKLTAKIDELETQYMTAEERARRATEETEKKAAEALANLTGERDSWKGKYQSLVVRQQITSASVANKAWDADQISAILNPYIKIVDAEDKDGKLTGEQEVRVLLPDTNKDGKPIVMDLTPTEAVKRMREIPKYQNLFEGDKTSGVGQMGRTAMEKKMNMQELVKDPAAYRRARKERPELFA